MDVVAMCLRLFPTGERSCVASTMLRVIALHVVHSTRARACVAQSYDREHVSAKIRCSDSNKFTLTFTLDAI